MKNDDFKKKEEKVEKEIHVMTLKDLFGNHMQAKMFQKVWEW